ncbi:MAG: response regulator transcription factor [Pseudomonadota bacterium]
MEQSTISPRSFTTALIVDDHPLFCDALTMTLRLCTGISEIRTSDKLQSALDVLSGGYTPDVVILDLNLPDVSGLDGLVRICKACPDIPVLVVSSMADNRMIASSLRGGAAGFVPKHSQRDVFQRAFETIAAGEQFAPPGYVPIGSEKTENAVEPIERLSLLTRQQSRILELICEGKLNKQIAFDLSIAETTVKAHVTAIMRKLGVQSRTQAVLIAQQARFAHVLHQGADAS